MATKTFYATKDAVMAKSDGGFSGWNGKDNHIQVGATSSFKWRGVVYFSLDFDNMQTITDARLFLVSGPTSSAVHETQDDPPSTLRVARMTKDWGEGGNDPGEGNATSTLDWHWNNRFDTFATGGDVTKSIDQGAAGSEESIGVTDIVNAWFNGTNNYGFILINTSSETNVNKAMLFYSREAGGSNRPRLEVTYTTNNRPNTSIVNSPSGGDTVQGLVPSFSATRDDPDSGDYVTGARILVYDAGYAYTWSTSTSTSPGSGVLRVNNATQSSATAIYANETTQDGRDVSAGLGAFSGMVTIYSADGTRYLRYTISSVVDSGTYRTINSSLGTASGTLIDGETVFMYDSFILNSTDSQLLWDSGTVTVTGNPTGVTVPYGIQGTATPLQGNRNYMWQVMLKDKGNEWPIDWSRFGIFKANSVPNTPSVAISPAPVSAVPTNTPNFTITHNDNDPDDSKMYGYQIIVEGETTAGAGDWTVAWDTGAIDTSGSPATTKVVASTALNYGGSYRVKARTKDSNDAWSSYSTAQAFKIHTTGSPINLSPASGGSSSVTPIFSGERANSNYVIASYDIVVYSDDLQTTMWTSGALTSGISGGASFIATYAGSALVAGSYYQWKARVTSALGSSGYSALQRFFVNDASVMTNTVPLGAGIADLTPTFTSSRATSFNRFQIELYPETSSTNSLGTVIWESGTQSATIGAGGLGTQFTFDYPGTPAIVYATSYKWRSRVSADAGSTWSNWTGLSPFTTLSAATPTLTSVGGVAYPTHPWITDTTPDFVVTRGAADTISELQVRVYNAAGSVLIWDSGLVDITNGTTGTMTYAGPTLAGGIYLWDTRYRAAAGPTGSFSSTGSFTINSAPNIPTGRSPANDDIIADTLLPVFRASFSDPDSMTQADTPASWEIVVEEDDGTPVDTITVSSGLTVGDNAYQWLVADTTLSYSIDYRWRTRYQDSKGVWGAYSDYSAFILRLSPNGTIVTPSDGSIVNIATPQITWSYTGSTAQHKISIDIDRTDSSGSKEADVFSAVVITSDTTYTLPPGYLADNKYYDFTLTAYDSDEVPDPSPSSVNVRVEQNPPDPIVGLSPTSSLSGVLLEWDTAIMKTTPVVHKFVTYRIYRRLAGDVEWTYIDDVLNRTNPEYVDMYAGNNVLYQYRVTTVATVVGQASVEIESPDDPDGGSFAETRIEVDSWVLIGADRSADHIQELPVVSESHSRILQQESFETLGSNRKVILRGFVLGHEGSITCVWTDALVPLPTDPQRLYTESVLGRRILDYITNNKGPHILKSPFGDVWDVEFAGPEYQWGSGASLEVSLEWIEVGQTSKVSI